MIRINLLPPEYAQAQAKKEFQIVGIFFFGSVISILIIFYVMKISQARQYDQKIAAAQADLNRYQAIRAQIEDIQQKNQRLIAKRDVIQNLNKSRLIYPVFFEDFLPILPSDVWLTSLSFTEAGNSLATRMNVQALSNFALATFLTNLNQSKHFSAVEFSAISYSGTDAAQTLFFSINFNYRHQGPYPLEGF